MNHTTRLLFYLKSGVITTQPSKTHDKDEVGLVERFSGNLSAQWCEPSKKGYSETKPLEMIPICVEVV